MTVKVGTSKFVEINSQKSHYLDWGSAQETILLIHGDMRTSRSFDAVSRRLSKRFRVIALDLFGHGDSHWPKSGYRFKDRSENILKFIEEAHIGNITAVAHSTGAVALTLCAAEHTSLFKKLVLLEPMLKVDESFQKMVSTQGSRPRTTWASREELAELLNTHKVTRNWTEEVISDVVAHETFINPSGRLDMKWAPPTRQWQDREHDYLDLIAYLKQLSKPTLFVVSSEGKHDFSEAFHLEKETPDFFCSTVRDSGHNMYMERPDAISQLITAFCSGVSMPAEI